MLMAVPTHRDQTHSDPVEHTDRPAQVSIHASSGPEH